MKPAICTQCGAIIEVDETHEAGICRSCNTPFITEKAINHYNTTHSTVHNVTNNVTKIIHGNEKDEGEDFFNRGLTQLKLKRYGDAQKAFNKATELSPERAIYWFYLFLATTEMMTNLYGGEESFDNFATLATPEEKAALYAEYGVVVESYDDFLDDRLEAALAKPEGINEAVDVISFKIKKRITASPNAARAERLLSTLLGEDGVKPRHNVKSDKLRLLIIAAYGASERKDKWREKYSHAVNFISKSGSFEIHDPEPLLLDGVLDLHKSDLEGLTGSIWIHDPKGIRKLVARDDMVYALDTGKRIHTLEFKDGYTRDEVIAAMARIAEDMLILPERFTNFTIASKDCFGAYSYEKWERDMKYMPGAGCVIVFRGKFDGKSHLMYRYKEKDILRGGFKEVAETKWPAVSLATKQYFYPNIASYLSKTASNIASESFEKKLDSLFGEGHGIISCTYTLPKPPKEKKPGIFAKLFGKK